MAAGALAVAGAAVLWAFGGTLASALIDRGASALELTEGRAWLSALGVGAVLLVSRGRPPSPIPMRTHAPLLVLGLSIAAANYTYYAALGRLPVAVAVTIQYTAPALVVVRAAMAERRMPPPRLLAALVAACGGVALLADLPGVVREGSAPVDGWGLALAGASAVAFATYIVTAERVGNTLDTRWGLLGGFVVASAAWVLVQVPRGRPDTLLDPQFLPWVVVLAVATTIAPFTLFLWAMRRIDASRAGVVSTLEPLAAAALAYVWLGQRLSFVQLVGGAMVVTAIAVVRVSRPLGPEDLVERTAVE